MNKSCAICGGGAELRLVMPIDPKTEGACAHGAMHWCRTCDVGMIQPRPRAEEVGGFYELENYYTHGRSHLSSSRKRTVWDRVRVSLAWRLDRGEPLTPEMVHRLVDGRPVDVCDIGCGDGSLLAGLAALGHRVVGVEVDGRAIAQARKRGVAAYEGTAEQLPAEVSGRRFDLVVMSHVLEHVLSPVRAIEGVRDILRPGGLFLCVVPNNACAGFERSGLAWEPLDVPRHLNFFTARSLRMVAERAGLRVRRVVFSEYTRQFHNEWIDTEARIWQALVRHGGRRIRPLGRKNSSGRAWGLLAQTAFAAPASKYDTVGVIAEKVEGSGV